MSSPEPPAHTFLLRVWVEETSEEGSLASWRGRVTHLVDQEHRYVQSFGEIADFVRGYLVQKGPGIRN